ncbi:MAG: putative signal transduction histidine kinase [Chthoniobacteraceae bacterium]|nr:putative signal transduction histidine kinase [Chthoniobacteraceae bacterium]
MELLSTLVDTIGSLVVVLDREGRIVRFNKACEELSGYSFNEVKDQAFWGLILIPEELEMVRREFDQLLGGALPRQFENQWLNRQGERRWITWSNTALYDQNGAVEFIVGVGCDFTERRLAEAELLYQLRLTRAITDQATDSIFVTDKAGRILFLNQKAERAFGFGADELKGRMLHDFVHRHGEGDSSLASECPLAKICKPEGARRHWEDLFFRKDGTPVTVTCSFLEIDDKRTGSVLVVHDTTERKQTQMELASRGLQQAAVAKLGEHALAGGDLNALLKEAALLVASTLNVEYCSVLEALPNEAGFLLKEGFGWDPGVLGHIMPIGFGASYALSCSEPVVSADIAKECRFKITSVLRDHKVASSMKVVIAGLQRPFGIIAAHTTRPRTFTQDDIHFLQSIANVLAMVIRRKSLEREVLEICDAERRRFARDLHDGVCQHFTGIGMMAMVLEKKLAAKRLPETRQAQEISRLLRDGSELAREVMEGLSPVNIENGGLFTALSGLAEMVEKRLGFKCRFVREREAVIQDSFIAGHLLRIAQEAVENAVKHSQGKNIGITLATAGSHLVLKIKDDGIGLPESKHEATGMGLQVMRYRAALINASLSITRVGKRGTLLTCSILIPGRAKGN